MTTPYQFASDPYNEINLDLSHRYTPGTDPIEVRAILIDWNALEANPRAFKTVLKDAQKRGIPILLKRDPGKRAP